MEIISIAISSEYFPKAMDIYQVSFPDSERYPLDLMIERLRSGKEVLYGLMNSAKQLLGIFIVWDLEFKHCKVLDYFAIAEEYRNQNYGEMFLAEMIKVSMSKREVLVLEIETPYNVSSDSLEFKRLKFYRKFNIDEYPQYYYRMPNLSGDGFLDMRLITIGNKASLTNKELDELVLEIYKQIYYFEECVAREMISENCELSLLL